MAARGKRKSASRGKGGNPAGWFITGLLIGLGGAVFLYSKGFIPSLPEQPSEQAADPRSSEPELLGDSDSDNTGESRYDFFTVLPEMEVVVPEQELATPAASQAAQASASEPGQQYILQAGSFRSASDADQMKARLALLGSQANIQTVTVNNETWHRVRIGPVNGSRSANDIKMQLENNGIPVLVLKGSN